MNLRTEIANGLAGHGIEIGPGLDPIQLPPNTSVVYVDKPLEGGYAVAHGLTNNDQPAISVEYDIDVDGMLWAKNMGVDFVIACHLIEHLANPLRFIKEVWESLPVNGKLLLIVPDRELSFDFGRPSTSLDHLLTEYSEGCNSVSEKHIRQELAHSMGLLDLNEVPDFEVEKWRELTVHAHCWTGAEFMAMLTVAISQGLCNWNLVESYWPEDIGVDGFEFGLLLSKVEKSSNGEIEFISQYVNDVVVCHPGERARWPQFVNFLSREFGDFGLKHDFNPNGLLYLFIHEFSNENSNLRTIDLRDLMPQVLNASSVQNSPFGLGRVAAYWRGYSNRA
jgi:SAM-dependent methyltransferase